MTLRFVGEERIGGVGEEENSRGASPRELDEAACLMLRITSRIIRARSYFSRTCRNENVEEEMEVKNEENELEARSGACLIPAMPASERHALLPPDECRSE